MNELVLKISVGNSRVTRIMRLRNNVNKDKLWFENAPGLDQYLYLSDEYASVKDKPDHVKGDVAKKLRGLVGVMKLDYLFEIGKDKSDGDRRHFMNEELRDFLNLNDDGTENYKWDDVWDVVSKKVKNGWKDMSGIGSKHHQKDAIKGCDNKKFVCNDGREAVFSCENKFVEFYPDKGTFNYRDGDAASSFPYIDGFGRAVPDALGGEHYKYDMAPFFELMDELRSKDNNQ